MKTNNQNGKNLSKALLMGTALVSLSSFQAEAASITTAQISAIVLTPIAIANPTALHFGSMTQTGAGTMAIDTAGARTPSAAITAVTGAGLESQGVLTVTAAAGVPMDISIGAVTYTVDDAGAGAPMNVNAFNIITAAGGPAGTITATPGTTVSVPVGATLNLAGAQVPGTYTGNFTVNVNYQ